MKAFRGMMEKLNTAKPAAKVPKKRETSQEVIDAVKLKPTKTTVEVIPKSDDQTKKTKMNEANKAIEPTITVSHKLVEESKKSPEVRRLVFLKPLPSTTAAAAEPAEDLHEKLENMTMEETMSPIELSSGSDFSDSETNSNSNSNNFPLPLPLNLLHKIPVPPTKVEKTAVFPDDLNDYINKISEVKYTQKVPRIFDQALLSVHNLRILPSNDHIVALQTIMHNKHTVREDFVFTADRLIRLVIEEGLNHLPFNEKTILTPTGEEYKGVEYLKSNCGVSIVRSGEAMEKSLRDCCRSIRIGKILIHSDEENPEPRVLYARLPPDISLRKVLLLYPIMGTGKTVISAVHVLLNHGVKEGNIILINLFSTPNAIRAVSTRFSKLFMQTTDVHPVLPANFGKRYFGTD